MEIFFCHSDLFSGVYALITEKRKVYSYQVFRILRNILFTTYEFDILKVLL